MIIRVKKSVAVCFVCPWEIISIAFIMRRFVVFCALAIASCYGQLNYVSGNLEDLDLRMSKVDGATGKKWALLVAGSRYYYNYRHQADVCHAYQVVSSHGIPDEQIVVMMYDDIANNPQNPVKGQLINHPDGPNVYKGVPKDYTGMDVTAENFVSVLTGKKQMMKNIGSGKVIDSGPDDHVFVFFSDHGAPGLIAFPNDRLYQDDLANAIKYMHTNKRYQQMVLYIEACESGSMFHNSLANDINVYATTAANRSQSSYACYFDKMRNAYLGDRYSVTWMEDSDKEDLSTETLHHQFEITKIGTNQSQVVQFGDLNMANEPVGIFQGNKKVEKSNSLREIRDDVPSPDVKIHVLYNMIKHASSFEEESRLRKELNEEYKMRDQVSNAFGGIADIASGGQNGVAAMAMYNAPKLNNMSCYKTVVEWFDRVCFDLDEIEFGYRKLYVLGNLCDSGIPTDKILTSISQMCK